MTIDKLNEYRNNLIQQKNNLDAEAQRIQAALEQTKNNAIATAGAIQALDNVLSQTKADAEAAAAPTEAAKA